jgi:hypothetical protein
MRLDSAGNFTYGKQRRAMTSKRRPRRDCFGFNMHQRARRLSSRDRQLVETRYRVAI